MKHKSFIYFSRNSESFQSGTLTPNAGGEFILSPFDGHVQYFDYSPCLSSTLDFSQDNLDTTSSESTPKTEHISLVEQAIEAINKSELNKVVVARKKNIAGVFDIQKVLKALQEAFPAALIYCLRLGREMWIGATPEILIEGKEKAFQTYSLAGTKPVDESFTQKEIEEQQFVTDYIAQKLENTKNLNIGNTKELFYGKIKHLLSVVQFESNSINSCLEQLHPTPAVLGVPSESALHFINENEKQTRDLYAGYLGFTNPEKTFVYVNLRCGKVHSSGIELFVGGGIVKDSAPEDEWTETENKVATFTTILNKHTLESI